MGLVQLVLLAVPGLPAAPSPGPAPSALPPSGGEGRLWLQRYALEGPVSDCVVPLEGHGLTRMSLDLVEGERREVVLPLPVRVPDGARDAGLAALGEPAADVGEGGGSARPLGWIDEQPDAGWRRVPLGLRARPLPPLGTSEALLAPVGPAATAMAIAAVLGVWSLRRRRALCVAAAAVLALVAAVIPLAPAVESARLLESLDGGERWLEVRLGAGRLGAIDLADALRLEVRPEGAPIVFSRERPSAPGASDDTSLRWTARAPGRTLALWSRFGGGVLERGRNELGDLSKTWVRERGVWSARGPWPRTSPLPAERPPGDAGGPGPVDAPPGWLVAGLPQGVDVVAGRLAPGSGDPHVGPGGAWVRAIWTP